LEKTGERGNSAKEKRKKKQRDLTRKWCWPLRVSELWPGSGRKRISWEDEKVEVAEKEELKQRGVGGKTSGQSVTAG